jgi:hypothetical protein
VAVAGGPTAVGAAGLFGPALVTCLLVATGELGQAYVQASAYGDERRFPLRVPATFIIPLAVTWAAWCAAVVAGPLLLAARAWALGVPVALAAVGGSWFLPRPFHRLSRRWLVVVPAGLVLHDHVVLSETAMFPVAEVALVGLALAGTEAADLTGPAGGNAVEIALTSAPTVILGGTRSKPGGTAIHVRSVLVAPTRPGRALRECAARQLPVG